MAITQETVVLNEYGLNQRTRTTSKGTKARYTIQIQSEPLIHNFAARELGKEPANAIKNEIVRQIKGISEVAKPATLAKRKYARKVLLGLANDYGKDGDTDIAASDQRIIKRYSGGRTGTMLPDTSVRLFNDSGRLANLEVSSNRADPSDSVWEINVPANRLDPTTFGDMEKFKAMVLRLQQLVPALGTNTKSLLESPEVSKAITDSIGLVLIDLVERNIDLRRALRQAKFDVASQIVGYLI